MQCLRNLVAILIVAVAVAGCGKRGEPAPIRMTSFQIDVGTTDVYLVVNDQPTEILGIAHRMPTSNQEIWILKKNTQVPLVTSYFARRIAAVEGDNPYEVATKLVAHLKQVHNLDATDLDQPHYIQVGPNASNPHPSTPGMSFKIHSSVAGSLGALYGVVDLREVTTNSYSELWIVPPGVYPLHHSFFAIKLQTPFSASNPASQMIQYLEDNHGHPLETIRVESSE